MNKLKKMNRYKEIKTQMNEQFLKMSFKIKRII